MALTPQVDTLLSVSRFDSDPDPHFIVDKVDGNQPRARKNEKLSWSPANGGHYDGGSFALLGVSAYDPGDFPMEQIEVDTASVSAKVKGVQNSTTTPYILLVLDMPDVGDYKVYFAFGGPPPNVHPLAAGDRPDPPPTVIIDP